MKRISYIDEEGKYKYRWEYDEVNPSWNMPNWLANALRIGAIVGIAIFLL